MISPWDISAGSEKYMVTIQCDKKEYHVHRQNF